MVAEFTPYHAPPRRRRPDEPCKDYSESRTIMAELPTEMKATKDFPLLRLCR
jgi:hypothetical protein